MLSLLWHMPYNSKVSSLWDWFELYNSEFNWSFTAMQSNRGKTITFLSHHFKSSNNQPFQFSCYLKDWKTTEDYSDFYWASKSLKMLAEVIRV